MVSKRNDGTLPDAAMIWNNAQNAFDVSKSGYDGNMFRAFQKGEATIDGDAGVVF